MHAREATFFGFIVRIVHYSFLMGVVLFVGLERRYLYAQTGVSYFYSEAR